MATELTVQSERAFQKQPHIFLNAKTKAKSKKTGQGRRWYKEVGLGFRTPKTAIEGHYIGMHDRAEEFRSRRRYLRFPGLFEIGSGCSQAGLIGVETAICDGYSRERQSSSAESLLASLAIAAIIPFRSLEKTSQAEILEPSDQIPGTIR